MRDYAFCLRIYKNLYNTFDSNGGTGEMSAYYVEKGKTGFLPSCEFVNDGYECMAWSTDNEGNSLYGTFDTLSNSLLQVKNGETVALYAVWTTPGFLFNVEGIGFLLDGVITNYDGSAKDVIVPAYTNDHFVDSWSGRGHVRKISSPIFKNHTEIQSVKNLPSDEIVEQLFYGCISLKTIETRKEITQVRKQAFYNCGELTNFDLGSKCTAIGEEAFYLCNSIKKIVIPASVTEIGKQAFGGWDESQTIEFTEHTENIFGTDWLINCSANIVWKSK